MLDDPRANFAISTRGCKPGLNHLGIQVENQDELHKVYARLRRAGGNIIEQGQTACCYAKSEKSWIDDPAGISWETFHTTDESTDYGYGSGEHIARIAHEKSCCVPQTATRTAACGCSPAEVCQSWPATSAMFCSRSSRTRTRGRLRLR
jgi:hypothetical protein